MEKKMQYTHDRGLLTAHIARSLAAGGSFATAAAFSAGRGRAWDEAAQYFKAAVTGLGSTELDDWRGRLAADLRSLFRGQSILGRLRGIRRVSFNTTLVSTPSGATASWVGSGNGIVIQRQSSAEIAAPLEKLKIGAITVITRELAMLSDPSADSIISADLSSALRRAEDAAFCDPNNSGIPDEQPASVTYGAASRASTGSSIAQVDSDLLAMLQAASAAGANLSMSTWVMSETTAAYLASLRGSSGAPAFPGVRIHSDGELYGIHQIASQSIVSAASPTNQCIALIDGSQVWLADGEASITASSIAALQMDDAPTGSAATGTGSQMTSLFQTESVAIKSVLHTNWARVSSNSVQVLSGVTY
jgi:hypothetical protein